uniref:Uncharacterized protein n=1 Tax=Mus spicilegus TaxID=10103 RepID=A0A8C6GQC9_MUSSI
MQKACGAREAPGPGDLFPPLCSQHRKMGLGNSFWFSGFVLLWFWSGFCIFLFFLGFIFSFFSFFFLLLSCHSPSQKPPSTLLI